ncbi:hypothetical protein CY34DRAFT_267930 [Suillus luteus UH-Slu-Lm8-n1]|uniref:Uncharacterized protein n=1 Tax=Suillus luteus UH-Slu-Lm8-n1 TaxID=930992 RepID=A0A0D0AFK2_9AGAM|nr:hypothetical protein CY34DRAFT_267930 [Suillus luteus UH-Slu-Lm8-n1]
MHNLRGLVIIAMSYTLEKVELGSESMQTHARRTDQGVAKLKLVLQDILDAAKKEDVGVGLSLVVKDGKLALYKRHEGTGKALGKDITAKFNWCVITW